MSGVAVQLRGFALTAGWREQLSNALNACKARLDGTGAGESLPLQGRARMEGQELITILNGQYVLVERSELRSWQVDVREAQGHSNADAYHILDRVIIKMQNQLNCEMTTIDEDNAGE